ncbi:MAG: hypothetical protein A3F91_09375 [Flavobacteria bacterium RIFCSPLOWO2_12_FULL_35_11]|nr:MAG: hypothetical protein A3F91_09375 [Flavobacteria bacterium RIFCSPLOWO2_12_FULL_35_11]
MDATTEYNKLIEAYKSSLSMSELEAKLREIPLEVREEVIAMFDVFLIRDTLEFFDKSEHPLHKNISVSEDDIKIIAASIGNEEELHENLVVIFGEKNAGMIRDSLDSSLKISNQVALDTIVFKLENSFYNDKNFNLENFKSWGRTSVNSYIKDKLSSSMELNIYRGKNNNTFTDVQKQALALVDRELVSLVNLKNMSNGLERAAHLLTLDFREQGSMIKPHNLGIDKEVMVLAEKCRELDINVAMINYNVNAAQSIVVDKFFENANIDKDKFLRQIKNPDGFLNAIKNNLSVESISVTCKFLRDTLVTDMVSSEEEYVVKIDLFNNSIAKVEALSLHPEKENWALVVPTISDEELESINDLLRDNSVKMSLE